MGHVSLAVSSQTVITKLMGGGTSCRKLIPRFGSEIACIIVETPQEIEGQGMDLPARLAARTETLEILASEEIGDRLRDDGPRRVMCAQEQ